MTTVNTPLTLSGTDIVNEAKKFLGDPYVYGATGPSTFDCSGLVVYVFKQFGVNMPRTSEEQFNVGTPITASQAMPGDLVFFGGSGPGYRYDGTPSSPGHVGIVVAPGEMINAPTTGEKVRIQPIVGAVGYRRVLTQNAVNAGAGAGVGAVNNLGNTGVGGLLGGASSLISFPDAIVNAFTDIDSVAGDIYKGFTAFFKPSTYVRIGAGFFGFMFVITGLFFLLREAHQ